MTTLGLDYGLSKIGLAIASGPLAAPLKVIRYSDESVLLKEIKRVVNEEKVDKIIVGISEGESALKAKAFGERLGNELSIAIEYEDETLSTEDVLLLTREAGIRRKKRKEMEDAYAATLILQNYLDR